MEEKIKITSFSIARIMLAIVISCFILFLLFRSIDITNVLSTLRKSDARLLFIAAAISIAINIVWGTLKWKRVLAALGCTMTFKEALVIRSGCLSFKIVFPLKSAELLKALYLAKKKNISFGRGISSLFIDKVFNLFITIVFFLIGLVFSSFGVHRTIPLLAFVALILLMYSRKISSFVVAVSKIIHPRAYAFTGQLLSGFNEISRKDQIVLLGYSFIYQLSEFVNTYLLCRAVGVIVPVPLLLVAGSFIMIINNLPITIMGLGTREAMIIFFFSSLGKQETLLSAGLLVSLIEHLLPVAIGVLFMKSFLGYSMMQPVGCARKTDAL